MFKVIDMTGCIHDAYGTFIDKYGDVQFVLCDVNGQLYKTDHIAGYYRICKEYEPEA